MIWAHKTSALLVLSVGNIWYKVWIRCVRQEMSVLWSSLVHRASLTYRSHPICSVTVISCRASCCTSTYLHAPTHQVKETERTTTSPLWLHHVEGEQTDLWSGCTSHDHNKAVMMNTSAQFLGASDSWHRLQVLFCLFTLVPVCLKLVISSIPPTLADNFPVQSVIDEVVFPWWLLPFFLTPLVYFLASFLSRLVFLFLEFKHHFLNSILKMSFFSLSTEQIHQKRQNFYIYYI